MKARLEHLLILTAAIVTIGGVLSLRLVVTAALAVTGNLP